MRNSKVFSSLILAGLTSALLAGCSLPANKSAREGADSASFVVQALSGEVTETKVISGFSIPSSKSFAFTACVVDLKQSRPVLNHKFKIRGTKLEQEAITDGSGCLHWSEEIAYNHFGEAKYVRLDRGLLAEGLQKGERNIRLALNPWENKVYDLEKKTVENLASAESTEFVLKGLGSSNSKSLIMSDLQVFVQDKDLSNSGNSYRMEVRGQPNLQFKKSSKEDVYESLMSGQFQVRLRLAAVETEKSVEKKRVVFQSNWISTESVRGQIAVPVEFKMSQVCGRGNYVLGVEIKPVLPENYKLKTSEALYLLSTCDNFSGRIPAVLSSQASSEGPQAFSLNDYFGTSASDSVAPAHEPATPVLANNFLKSGLFLRDFSTKVVDHIGTSPFDRKVTLEIASCFTTTADGKNFKAQNLMVTKMDGSSQAMTTLPDGCIRWDEALSFKVQDQECEQAGKILISHQNLDVKMEIPILVNPWSKTVRNGYSNPDVKNRAPVCSSGKSFLMTSQFEFKNSKYSSSIDPYLNLTVHRTGTFQVQLALYRPSITTEDKSFHSEAPNGQYSLSLALLKDSADILSPKASDLLMLQQKNVQVHGLGVVSEELSLAASNLKEIGSASQLVLMIKPLNPSANFQPKLFKGTFVNSNVFEAGPLVVVKEAEDLNLDELFEKYAQLKTQDEKSLLELSRKLSTKSQLRSDMQVAVMNLNDDNSSLSFRTSMTNPIHFLDPRSSKAFTQNPLSADHLKSWLKNEKLPLDMAQRLCLYWFYDFLQRPMERTKMTRITRVQPSLNILAQKCRNAVEKNVAGFYDVQYRSFLKNPSLVSEESTSASDYTISQAFNLGRAHVQSDATTTSFDWNAGLNLKFLEVLGVGGGFRKQYANTDQTAQQEASANSFVNQINTTIENIALKIRAEKTEKCMIIKIRPEIWSDIYFSQIFRPEVTNTERALAARSGLMICEGQWSDQPKEFTENYWIVNQNMRGSQATSPQSASSRKFVGIRGTSDFLSFMSQITDVYALPATFKNEFIGKTFLTERVRNLYLKDMPGSSGQIIHTEAVQ